MALIHEQLYESADLRRVDLKKHTKLLLGNLFQAYGVEPGRIAGSVEFGEGTPLLGVDKAIPAGLILNELISNALKHAFPGGRRGSILVEGRRSNGNIVLDVCDSGIGLPDGFRVESSKSLGLRIVQILTRQLKGTVEVHRDGGTRFRICFPENSSHPR
jgi:two-component sensor histidine kinase